MMIFESMHELIVGCWCHLLYAICHPQIVPAVNIETTAYIYPLSQSSLFIIRL